MSRDSKTLNPMKPYNDMFDIMDDTNDGLQFTSDELNRYFLSGHLKPTINEDEVLEIDTFDNSSDVQVNMKEHEEEEEEKPQQDTETILSQKMSELSTNNQKECDSFATTDKKRRSSTSNTNSKRMKISYDDEEEEEDDLIFSKQYEIPTYLQMNNKSFIRMAQHIMKDIHSFTLNDIHKIVVSMYLIESLHIKKQIAEIYLKSVTGILQGPDYDLVEVDHRVVPIQIKSLMFKQCKLMTMVPNSVTTATDTTFDPEQFVCQHLRELNETIEHLQQQLNELKTSLIGFTGAMEECIHIYIKEYGIKPLELKRDTTITKITYNYESEILKRKYLEEQPNEYQIEVVQRLINRRCETENSKRLLMELKQGIFFHKSFIFFDPLQISIPTVPSNTTNDKLYRQFSNMHEKIIDYHKLDSLAVHLLQAEIRYYRCQNIFDSALSQMWTNHRNLVKNQGMTTGLLNLIEKQLDNVTNRWRDVYNYRIDYFLQNSYYEFDSLNHNEKQDTPQKIGFSYSLFIDTKHRFTQKQLQILSRGPSYIPPCQTYISFANKSMYDITKKQFAPLNHQLASIFAKHNIHLPVRMEFQSKMYEKFEELFSSQIPSSLYERAYYEKELIQSIRNSLKKNNLILRRNSRLKRQRGPKSDDYKVLVDFNLETNEKPLHIALKDMIESMNSLIEKLKTHKSIKDDLYNRLVADPTKVKLPYLYFLPNVSKDNTTTLVPFITSKYSSTWKIGKYLNQLLRPFVDKILKSKTFYDESDFIRKLNYYANTERRLRSTTLFCTVQITNFYTMDTHKNMLDIVEHFLSNNLATNKLESLTIETIRNLLYLVLYNNVFYYKNKLYAFTKGGPNTMPLTETLSTIDVSIWQEKILKEIDENIEFFGRYKDRLFFTWNKSSALELETFLEDIREKFSNVRFQKLIGTSVQFLNAYIENREGQLYTRVHIDTNIPRYTLPYVTGCSKSAYSDWLQSALIRAACFCTLVDDFQQERVYLELTLLINGYSLLFVETHVKHFFNYFHAQTMRFSSNQKAYDKFRGQWLDFTIYRQQLSVELEKFADNGRLFAFHYMYDFGPRCRFNREFRRLWFAYFQHHPVFSEPNSKITLTSKNFHSLNTLLAFENPLNSIQQ
ncbi:unnamed protein product [Rotaria sp. Silwood1]|nr:unnamed protein product [Rotaria sp. Silwood1]